MLLTPQQPETPLPRVDARTTAAILATSADLTLLVQSDDTVSSVSHSLRGMGPATERWQGRPIGETVRRESLPALKDMLMSARRGKPSRRFELVHPLDGGRELTIQYMAVCAGEDGELVLVGRDLGPTTELQARLLASRQSLEDSSKRQRQAEAHYRLLFETTAEAILIVEPESGKIREVNPRAASILGRPAGSAPSLAGKKLASLFAKPRQNDVQALLSGLLASGMPATLSLDRSPEDAGLTLAAELFRAGDLKLVLIRLSAGTAPAAAEDTHLGDLVRHATEAVLLADGDGRIAWVNEAFLALASLAVAAQAIGRPLDAFFEWQGIEQEGLLANVRTHGRLPLFQGVVRGANGQTTEVELSAVAQRDGKGFAFVMRARGSDDARPNRSANDLTRTAENLVEMIGRVPMKDMVRDTTDVIERMCIEAALKLSLNNRALTARVLGLSRQALYLKMRRFGIDDGGE